MSNVMTEGPVPAGGTETVVVVGVVPYLVAMYVMVATKEVEGLELVMVTHARVGLQPAGIN